MAGKQVNADRVLPMENGESDAQMAGRVFVVSLVVAGGYFVSQRKGSTEPSSCQPSLPIRSIGGRIVVVETKATPNGTCPVPRTNEGTDTLGVDCKVRDENGTVVETVTTLADGSC